MQKEQFNITGMTCSACSTRVEQYVAKLPGVAEVSVENINVTPEESTAIEHEKRERTLEKTLQIEGMMCQHCVMHVQKALAAIPGVKETAVSLEEKTAKVKLNQDVAVEAFKTAVETAGYQLTAIK